MMSGSSIDIIMSERDFRRPPAARSGSARALVGSRFGLTYVPTAANGRRRLFALALLGAGCNCALCVICHAQVIQCAKQLAERALADRWRPRPAGHNGSRKWAASSTTVIIIIAGRNHQYWRPMMMEAAVGHGPQQPLPWLPLRAISPCGLVRATSGSDPGGR